MRAKRFFFIASLTSLFAGCECATPPTDGPDRGGSAADAAAVDATHPADAARVDAVAHDSFVLDAWRGDGIRVDAAPSDSAQADGTRVDSAACSWSPVTACGGCAATACASCAGTLTEGDGCGHTREVSCTVPASGCSTRCCGDACCSSASEICHQGSCCQPTTCAAQGKNCGTISDGCGGDLNCGTCANPASCGRVAANVCNREYCNATGDGEVCFALDVPGNEVAQSLTDVWPLETTRLTRRMKGVTRQFGHGTPYQLQIIEDPPDTYEGQAVTPVRFVKNHPEGYWDPGSNKNLVWMVVTYGQSPWNLLWARGHQEYDRGCYPSDVDPYRNQTYPAGCADGPWSFVKRLDYASLDAGVPGYLLMLDQAQLNPANDGLTNSRLVRHQYSACYGSESCVLDPPWSQHWSWFMGISNAAIKVPQWGSAWVDAKRVEYVELTLPGGYSDSTGDPYNSNLSSSCRCTSGALPPCSEADPNYYRGVREDWFFVPGTGIALIVTRGVGQTPDYECSYTVALEDLSFASSDTFVYLVKSDQLGYDNLWNF